MAGDIFLKIDGLKGESQDDKHTNSINILSYSVRAGASAPETADTKEAEASGPGEIVIIRKVDTSSPELLELCSTGKHISKVVLNIRRAGEDDAEDSQMEMSDVVISQVSPQDAKPASESDPELATESITLTYGTIKWTYTQQKRG